MSFLSNSVKKYPALAIFVLATAISGGIIFLYSQFDLPGFLMYVAAFGATISGIILAAIEGGKESVKELLGRFLIWKTHIGWYILAFFATFATAIFARFLYMFLAGVPFDILNPAVNIPDMGLDMTGLVVYGGALFLVVMSFFQAGIGEEFGWRGYAMPRLQTRYNALISTLIIGFLWGIWHTPLFIVRLEGMDLYYNLAQDMGLILAVLLNTVLVICWSIQMTCIFNNTNGSVLLACLFHGTTSTAMLLFMYNGVTDIGANYELMWLYLFANIILSVLLILYYGPTHLSRRSERNVISS